jgi:NAD(P)-dependent dehydrogenase (short-subunit alcohol dehydrogenase family)
MTAGSHHLTGRRVIITGGGSGIGAETAGALAAHGADITIAVRDITVGEQSARKIQEKAGADNVAAGVLMGGYCSDGRSPPTTARCVWSSSPSSRLMRRKG